MYKDAGVFEFSGGEVVCWIEPDSCIMLKAVAHNSSDPVELTETEALRLAQRLVKMAYKLDPELLDD